MLLVAITSKIISKITRSTPNYYPKTFSTFSAALLNYFLWHTSPVCMPHFKAVSIQFNSNKLYECEVCGKKKKKNNIH